MRGRLSPVDTISRRGRQVVPFDVDLDDIALRGAEADARMAEILWGLPATSEFRGRDPR